MLDKRLIHSLQTQLEEKDVEDSIGLYEIDLYQIHYVLEQVVSKNSGIGKFNIFIVRKPIEA